MGYMNRPTEQVRELNDADLDAVTGGASMPAEYSRMGMIIVAATTGSPEPQQSALGDLFNSVISDIQKTAGGTPR